MDLNCQPQSERPVTATRSLNWQKVKLTEENQRFAWRATGGKLNFCLATVTEIIAGLGYIRSHTNTATSVVLESIRFEVVSHPPYSPDLAPYDFLLAAVKKHLKGTNFTCDDNFKNSLKTSKAKD